MWGGSVGRRAVVNRNHSPGLTEVRRRRLPHSPPITNPTASSPAPASRSQRLGLLDGGGPGGVGGCPVASGEPSVALGV